MVDSTVLWQIECQVEYIVQTLVTMDKLGIRSVEPRRDKTDEFQEKMSKWTLNKNFSTSCKSWYKNKDGKNFVLWPSNLLQYWWMTFRPNLLEDFKLEYFKE